jgi:hypothetical protein
MGISNRVGTGCVIVRTITDCVGMLIITWSHAAGAHATGAHGGTWARTAINNKLNIKFSYFAFATLWVDFTPARFRVAFSIVAGRWLIVSNLLLPINPAPKAILGGFIYYSNALYVKYFCLGWIIFGPFLL